MKENLQIKTDCQPIPPPPKKAPNQPSVSTALLLLFCCVVMVMEPKALYMRGTLVLGEHPSPSHNISLVTLTFNEDKHSLDSTLKSAINAFHTKREKDEKENRTFPFRHRIKYKKSLRT